MVTVSNKDSAKKEREEHFLNRVKSVYPGFPDGEIHALTGKQEPPDFLVKSKDRVVGIELVDYIRGQGAEGSPLRHEETRRENVIKKAQEEFETEAQLPMEVLFLWHGRFYLSKMKRPALDRLAHDIALLVEGKIPQESHYATYIDRRALRGSSADGVIVKISITRLRAGACGHWASTETGYTDLYPPEVQQLISSKERNFDRYKGKCDSVWLVIIASAEHVSSIPDIRQEVKEHVFRSQFDRVLLYRDWDRSIMTLVAKGVET